MKLHAYATHDKSNRRLTSYRFKIDDIDCFVDFGSADIQKKDVENVDYIFITHEHLDHWGRLLDLAEDINPSCKIFTTETTKRIILKLIELNAWNNAAHKTNKLVEIMKKIKTARFYNLCQLSESVEFAFYPSGHTFGSGMVYLKGKTERILFTGDMDYVKKAPYRQYDIPNDLQPDYLIIDSTHFSKYDIKKDYVRSKVERTIKHKNMTYYSRPEKAIALAYELSRIPKLQEYKIHYNRDLKWYLKILTEQGYNPFIDNRIRLGIANENTANDKIILITSQKKYQRLNAEYTLGLHLSYEDTVNFINQFNVPPKVYLTHFNLADKEAYEDNAISHGYYCLQEGEQIL